MDNLFYIQCKHPFIVFDRMAMQVLIRLYEFHKARKGHERSCCSDETSKSTHGRFSKDASRDVSDVWSGLWTRLTLILKDRPFADVLSKLKEALDYAAG